MKKTMVWLVLVALLLTSCAAFAEDATSEVYRTLYSGEITSLNYLTTATTNEFALAANVIDTLVEYNKYGEIQPSLALTWDYDAETLTYTFKLHEDAT